MSKTLGQLKKIKEAFGKVYLINDPYILDVLCANYIAFLLKSDPVWTVIVAPPGGSKSEFINTLSACSYIHAVSTITANTLVSGAKLGGGKPASLLHKLSAGTDMEQSGIITFKDLTSLMSEQEANQKIIMAQLREIYDGHYDKEFGTGHAIHWKGKVTVIAAATYSIHDMRRQYSAMGERFMMYELIQPDRINAADRSMANQESGMMSETRAELAEMMRAYLNETIVMPEELPKIPRELKDDLLNLAELSTRARSEVRRAWYSPQKEILDVYPPEMPTRFAACLQTLARALMVLNWNETGEMILPENYQKILFKYSLDSITPNKREAMQQLAKYSVLETKGLAIKLDKPTTTLRRSVEDLVALGICEREVGSGSQGDRWKIKPHYKKLMQRFEGIEDTGTELTERSAEASEEDLLKEAEAVREEEKEPDVFDL